MVDCSKHSKSLRNNYACMQKGVGVGKNIKLPPAYTPHRERKYEAIYCGARSGGVRGTPYDCFRKGFLIGKNLQVASKENFAEAPDALDPVLVALVVALVVFGLLYVSAEMHWMWALVIGAGAGCLFSKIFMDE